MLPTVAARAMLGGGPRGASGLVPVGRDVPIGLNIERFLGAANPFGQDPFARPKTLDDAEVAPSPLAPAPALALTLALTPTTPRVATVNGPP